MDTSLASKENVADDDDSEESGWTSYFDDYFANRKYEPDMVSDAASGVVDQMKFSESGQVIPSASTLTKLSKKLNIKKRNKETLYDDSLEDTASSPVNSPKIMQVKGGIPDLRLDGRSDEKTAGMVTGGDGNECRGLRKPGPCLFSMSMSGRYFG